MANDSAVTEPKQLRVSGQDHVSQKFDGPKAAGCEPARPGQSEFRHELISKGSR